jgi:hypothetical protein
LKGEFTKIKAEANIVEIGEPRLTEAIVRESKEMRQVNVTVTKNLKESL